jgi:hypothetical protein
MVVRPSRACRGGVGHGFHRLTSDARVELVDGAPAVRICFSAEPATSSKIACDSRARLTISAWIPATTLLGVSNRWCATSSRTVLSRSVADAGQDRPLSSGRRSGRARSR